MDVRNVLSTPKQLKWVISVIFVFMIFTVGFDSQAAYITATPEPEPGPQPQAQTQPQFTFFIFLPVLSSPQSSAAEVGPFETLTTITMAPDLGSTLTDLNITFPFDFSLIRGLNNNPCTPYRDEIEGEGEIRIRITAKVDGDGKVHLKGHLRMKGEGEDKFGNKYLVMDSFNSGIKTGLPLQFIDNFKMISQGSTDNFIVNFSLHVNPNLNAVINLAGPLCRG